ncbi:hypothetical protein Tco_1573486, partial [Tanacetum coccineum]
QHKVEGRVERLVEDVEELESKQAEVVDKLTSEVIEEVAETYFLLSSLNHISNQGINGSQSDNAANDSIHEEDKNVNMNNGRSGCSYKEFAACKLKEFDGKGGAVAYTRWVEKIEAVDDISGCGDHQKVKYIADSLTEKALTRWNSEVHTRGREATVDMT